MKIDRKIKDLLALALIAVGMALIVVAFGPFSPSNDTGAVAGRVSSIAERRVLKLEAFMETAAQEDHSRWR